MYVCRGANENRPGLGPGRCLLESCRNLVAVAAAAVAAAAAAVAAPAAAAAAVAAPASAAAVTAATRPLFTRTGLVDGQGPTVEILVVQRLNRRLSPFAHLNEPEPSRASGLPVRHHLGPSHGPVLR